MLEQAQAAADEGDDTPTKVAGKTPTKAAEAKPKGKPGRKPAAAAEVAGGDAAENESTGTAGGEAVLAADPAALPSAIAAEPSGNDDAPVEGGATAVDVFTIDMF